MVGLNDPLVDTFARIISPSCPAICSDDNRGHDSSMCGPCRKPHQGPAPDAPGPVNRTPASLAQCLENVSVSVCETACGGSGRPMCRRRPRQHSGRVLAWTLAVLALSTLPAASATAALVSGVAMRCEDEGRPVQVPREVEKDNPCISCVCENKIVVCNKKRCPSVEGCYWRPKQNPDTCKGCVYNGATYRHGARWSDGCRHLECQAGVLTVAPVQCHVPCFAPIPPMHTGCCPSCKECWLEGRRVEDGQQVSPQTDPCVRCTCSGGRFTCHKRACPVLSCPLKKQVLSYDGCCMTCIGDREMFTLPGHRCFLNGVIFTNGSERMVDPCTNCTCEHGYLTCRRRTCPVLDCAQEFQVQEEGECCPSCNAVPRLEGVCLVHGTVHKDGDTWLEERCTSCSCRDGQTECHVLSCEYDNKACPLGFKREEVDHECCPRCVRAPGVCVVFGDPHYRTFDGMLFNFQGACKYWLAKTSQGPRSFSLKVINDARRSSHFSWTKSLSLRIQDVKIILGQKLRIKIDKKRVKAPYHKPGVLNMTRDGQAVTVTTPFGLRVLWDGSSYAEVEVPPDMQGQTSGLCGNFNGNETDDLTTKDGTVVSSADLMALSWATGNVRTCSRKIKEQEAEFAMQQQLDHDNKASTRSQRLTCPVSRGHAVSQCALLNSTMFEACHAVNRVDKFYESCVLDMCECKPARRCECDTLQAYARLCERLGIPAHHWRTHSKCGGLDCPRGAEYRECVPPCRATCRNRTPNPRCHLGRCRPGCFCPPPSVYHRGACIPVEECPRRGKKRHRNR